MEKASLVVMSHLSDAQAILNTQTEVGVTQHIDFAKYLILRTKGNLNQEIDPDLYWKDFLLTRTK